MEFKDKLKELRVKKGISQQQLADDLSISRSVVAKWETGLAFPSDYNTEMLCQYFEVEKAELLPNNEVELLLVEKNIEIKKSRRYFHVAGLALGIIIAILIIVNVSSVISKNNRIAVRKEFVPEVTNLFFNYNTNIEDENYVPIFNDEYLLLSKNEGEVFITLNVKDVQLDESYTIEPILTGCTIVRCEEIVKELISENKYAIVYKIVFRIEDTDITVLNLNSAVFKQNADNTTIIHNCSNSTSDLPVLVEKDNYATVTIKLNTKNLLSFTIPKGSTISETILENSFQMDMLDSILESSLDSCIGYHNFILNGWVRDDGLALNDKVYHDISLIADLSFNNKPLIDLQVNDTSITLYNIDFKPTFVLNGEIYDDVLYTLESDNDIFEISNGNILNAIKPGLGTVKVNYDLGFYKGETTFNLNVLDYAYVEIFSYYKGPRYETMFKAFYDENVNDVILSDDILNDAEDFFNKQNVLFEKETGYKRILKEIKRVSPTVYMPIFETEYSYNNDNVSLVIGRLRFSASSIPKLISVPIGAVFNENSIQYKVENVDYDLIDSTLYFSDANGIIHNNVISESGYFELYLQIYYEVNGVIYFTDLYKINAFAN